MTLYKLSWRNARRQARDYLVYFVTIVMAAALIYAFNGLVFFREIADLSEKLASLPLMIVLASAAAVLITGWLVSYTTGFMLSRRSRELGTYILIGLEHRQVARLFFLENLAVGGAALLLGLAAGDLLFQALRAVMLALFGAPYRVSLAFSPPGGGADPGLFSVHLPLCSLERPEAHPKDEDPGADLPGPTERGGSHRKRAGAAGGSLFSR